MARYIVQYNAMEDSNCTLTEPLRLMESLSESSCDEECVIRKPKKERIRPLVFCPHCKQMVSKTTFYRHQGLHDGCKQSESESSESFCEQLNSNMCSDELPDCYQDEYQDDQQADNELSDSIDEIESLSSVCTVVIL